MAIRAELADGRVLEFPDDTDQSVIDQTVRRAIQNPESTRSTKELEAVASAPSTLRDVAEAGVSGLAGGIKGLSDIFGVNNAVSKKMEELQRESYGRLTPERQREMQIEDELSRRAAEEGAFAEFKQAGRSFLRSPLQTGIQALTSSAPMIAATALAPEATIPAMLAGRAGLGAAAARTAIANAPAIGVGAAMGVGSQKGQDYERVKQAMLDAGRSEEEAEDAAQKAAEYSMQNAARQAAAGVAGGAEGAFGVESLLGRAGRARPGVKAGPEAPTWKGAIAQSTLGEALPEAVQSGVGAVGSNIALQQAGIDTDLFKGVTGEVTTGALAGALMGTAVSPLQMRQMRQEYARDLLEKQLEEQKKAYEEFQKKQEQLAKTKEELGTPTALALPAPVPRLEEQDPLLNPLGNFTRQEIGEILTEVEKERKKKGQPLLDSYSIEDLVDALPGRDFGNLIESRFASGDTGVTFAPQDVLNAATDKVDTTTQGFRDFLRRTTGNEDLETMSQPQLYAAFKALENVPVGQGLTILPEGTNATRFTEAQVNKGLEVVAAQIDKSKEKSVTPEHAIQMVKKAAKLKDDRAVASLLKLLVKENHLDVDADGNFTGPTKIENLPAGYTLEKGTFKQSDQQLYGVIDKDGPLEGVDTYTKPEDAQAKVDALNKTREKQAEVIGQQIKKIQDQIDQSQQELDALEAAGEGGTAEYKKAKAKHDGMVSKVTDNIHDLQARQMMFQTPLTMGPMGMKQVNRTGYTLFKDGVPVSTHPTTDAALDSLVGTMPEEEVVALAQDKTPGMRTVANKARQRLERQSRPARKEPEQKAPEVEVTEEDKKNAQVLYKALGRMLKKFGLGDVELQILKGMQDEGTYVANLIKIALDAKDPLGVLRHESIHALKDLGFFSPQQWATLERMAKEKWIDQYLKGVIHDKENNLTRYDAYVQEYKGKKSEAELEELLIEEAIADAFRDFGNKPPPGLMTAILNKIKDFFARLKEAFNMAGIETAEEIFGRIERGGLRASGKVGTGQAKASVRNTAKGFLNPNISAKQEKIINDVIDEMDLTQQEFASTSLIHQTGKAGVDQFESDKIGGLPEVVQFLQDERRKSGLPLLDIDKPEDRKLIAKLMATEAMAAIRSGGANLEWYDSIINKTLAMAGLKYQELNTDINARMAFKIATAITSQGLNVEDNLAFAMRVYDQYRVNKRFPEIGQGEDQNAMIKNFKLANYLMDDMGANLLRQFMETEFTVEEMRSAGFDIKGELGDEMVLGSSVFGPKIGFGFYSNLNGNFEPVTMDMWFMRTIGRLTGKLKSFRQDLYNAQLQKFRDEFDTEGDNGVFANQFDQDEIDIARIDNDAAEELARKVKSAHERDFKANRKAYDDGDREKSKLVAASETMIKSLDSPKDAPSNGTERRNLRDIVRQMVDIVEEKYGKRVPPASLQAVIWYPEQELYKAMGVKLRVTSQNYAGAIEKILKGEGYGESDLSAAAKLGSRTAQQLAKSAVSKGSKKAGTEPVRLGSLEDREKEALLERRRRQLVLEEEKQTPKRMRVIFEVAPDPNNKALTESWRSLPNEDRIRISEKIGNQIIKDALKKFGLTGYVDTQVGSYLDDTNPSFALYLNSGDSVAMAKFLGFVLSQDSMMVVSPKAAKGLEKTGAVRINVGDATPARIDRIYQQLRQIEVDGNKPVGGQSYMNGHMVVLNYSNVSTDQLASLINEKLDDKYEVITEDVYTAFPENKDYDYANPSSDPRGNAGVLRQASRDLRAEATRLLQKELRQFKQESSRRAKEGETPVERKSLRAPNTKEFKRLFGDTKVVDEDGNPQVVYRGVVGTERGIEEGALNAEPRMGYATFGSTSPYVANSYANPEAEFGETGAVTPLYIKADNLIEFPVSVDKYGVRRFDKFAFDRKAKSLPAGTALVARQVIDIGPRANAKIDPEKLYSYYSDIYAWGSGTVVKSATGNIGTYDETNLDIRKSLRAPDTPEFNNWFSDSKAVDKEGRAQVMYHGTARDISEFKPGVAKAIFISPDPEFAEIFSEDSFNWIANNAKDELSEADQTKTKETAIEQIEKDYEWLDKKDPDYKKLLAHKEGMIKDIQKNAFKKKLGDEAMGYLATAAKNYLPTGPNIMPLFVRAVNPFDYENKKHIDMVVGRVLNFMPESVTTKMEFPEKYLAGLKGLLSRGLFTKLEEDAVQKAIRSLGFDSFYVKEMGRKNLAVYSPVQVKSATGNIGTYGLDNPDIRKSLRPPQVPEKLQRIVNETVAVREDKNWLQRLMSAIVPSESDAFRQAAINRYQRIGSNEKRAAKIDNIDQYTADVSAEFAALHSDYAAQLMASAMGVHDGKGGIPVYKNGITMIWNDDGKITGPLDIFQPLAQFGDKAFQHWQFWKSAHRGVRLEKDGKPTQFGQAELQAAKELEALYPKGLFEQVDKAWDRYNRGLVNYMIDTGVINRKMGEEWMKHGDYFPFYRQQMDEDAKGPKMFSAISGVKAPKELKGGDITVGDFFENIIRNTQAAIEAGMKNVAAQKAIDNEVKIGDAKEIVGFKGEPKRPTSMSNVVTVLRNGEVHYYECKDVLFVESLKGLNMGEIPGLWLFSAPANLLRSFVTKTPDFILANMLRDSMSAWVTSGANITPVIDTVKGFGAAMAKTDPDLMVLYNAGLIGGYEFSGRARETGSRLAKKLRKSTGTKTLGEKALTPFTSVWEALESGSTASDAATRLAVYKNVMAETGNQAEAIKRAMEIMNFQRKGNSALIRFVAAAVPFLNARIQGLDVLYRAGIKPFVDRKNASEYEKQVANAFIKRGMLMAAMSVFYYMMVKDDEEYLAQEEEVRDGNWIIPGLGVKIPIPFEVGIIFKTIPERITALLFGNDTAAQFTDSMTRNIQQVFGLQLPQSILPAIEVATGYSFFTHRQITPQGLEDVNKKYQVAPGTSRLAEVIGEFTSFATATGQSYGLSPIQIDHLFKGYTGTLGTYFVDAVDVVINANSDIKSPTKRFEQMPFIRRFALDPDARGNVTAYYDFKNAVDEVVRTSNLLERTGKVEDLVEYQMNNMPLLASKDYVNDLYKTMKEFNDMKRMVRMSPMDPDDKRDIILAIQQSENALLSQIKEYKKMISQ